MLSFLFGLYALFHPIHVSVSEATYSEKDKALQITSRVFTDDIESAVRLKQNDPDLDILNPKTGTTDQLVLDYLTEHFKIKLDGKLQKMKVLGHEKEGPALIFYIEITNVKKIRTLEIYDDVITEIHDDQSNLFHITFKAPIKSARLTKNGPSETFRFDEK